MNYFSNMKNWVLFLIFIGSSISYGQKTEITLLIDPGHGGKDPGHLPTVDNLKQEKDLALEISLKVGNYLTHNLSNVNVLYTRTTDVYPSLDQRVDDANNNNVDYMLSIHINGNPNSGVYGTETHIHNYDAKDSYMWAKLIQSQFKDRAGRKSRGVKTCEDLGHSLQVLKFTKMPTVLVECGFITNSSEGLYLNTIYGQEIIASAIFRGTREFLMQKHPLIDFTPKIVEEEVLAESEAHYKVQIMSSIDSVSVNSNEFNMIDVPVERVLVSGQSIYKYKYYVGPFEDKKSAKKAQKQVQKNGFKDAFLVYFE